MNTLFLFRLFFFTMWLMIGRVSVAQLPVLFDETFSNNTNNWYVANTQDVNASIKNGQYNIELKGDFYWRTTLPVNINPKQDFLINLTIKQLSGKANYGHGLMWASDDWDNIFMFVVADGYYRIAMYKNGQSVPLKKWSASEAIHQVGKANRLTLSSKNNVWHFFINGTWVYSLKKIPFMGLQQGAVYLDQAAYQLDNFEIRQHKPQIQTIAQHQLGKATNMGQAINTAFDEIAPIVSADGNTLFWGRDQLADTSIKSDFDVFWAKKKPDGTWGHAQRMPAPINNAGDNLVVAVSTNLDALVLEGQYTETGKHLSDEGISISYRTNTGDWTVPKKIPISDFENRNEYMSFCLSTDRTVLIMSVERTEGYGSKDLFVSFLQPDSSYSAPKNMGSVLNSWQDEGTPFLAPDMKTLYFYSYTHAGYGRADIFVSKRLDDSWTSWSAPLNLGPQINTPNWDTYYTVSATGSEAYFTSSANSLGESDIFSITLPGQSTTEAMVMLKGRVLEKNTNQPVFASIVYQNQTTHKQVNTIKSDPVTGSYQILLEPGTDYLIKASANGYMGFNSRVKTKKTASFSEQELTLFLVPLKTGNKLTIPNLFFVQSRAEILAESEASLAELVLLMQSHPSLKIKLVGHTENRGAPDKLKELSEKRAETIRLYLIARGIAASRIHTEGKGAMEPLNNNQTEAERAQNRRVEIIIMAE